MFFVFLWKLGWLVTNNVSILFLFLNKNPPSNPIYIDAKSYRNGIFERPPSVATVQAISLMAIYEGICSGENSIESTWALMGLACKLAQSVSVFFFSEDISNELPL